VERIPVVDIIACNVRAAPVAYIRMIHRTMFDALQADKATQRGALTRPPSGTGLVRFDGPTAAAANRYGGIHAPLFRIIVHCRGILFDQPSVIAEAPAHDRMERVGGDFFTESQCGRLLDAMGHP
jgi:hypothetical protein